MSPSSAANESAALSRDLSEFLIELSIALHKHAIYPGGHPLLTSAEAGLALRLHTLLEARGTLSLGVARQQLVIEGVATDPGNPLLRELAQRLHRHHLGAVKFSRGVGTEELADLMRTLSADTTRVETPLGLGPPESLRRWEHVRLFSLTFEHLELLEEEEDEDRSEAELRDGSRFRAAQLWVGLARAALAAEIAGGDGEHTPDTADPAAVAKAIDEHSREQAYDQVIVGYLLQIATELQDRDGAEQAALRRRVSRMVSSLRPDTLRQLLHMGGDAAQRKRFVLDAAQGMAVDAVVELVRATAETSGQSVSHLLIRMLNKLALHAETGPLSMRAGAESALRENVQRLIEGWNLDDPNPGAYRTALEAMSRQAVAPDTGKRDPEAEPERMIEMSLELGVIGGTTAAAVEQLLEAGELGAVAEMLDAGGGDPAAGDRLWQLIATPVVLRRLVEAPHLDIELIERLVDRMGLDAAEPLLDGIEAAEERSARWKLLDLLAGLGPAVGPRAVARLEGAEWYVQRNLLMLLGRLPELPEGFSAALFVGHDDPRVRREALKFQLRSPALRESAIMSALEDADPRVIGLALGAAAEACPLPAAPVLLALVRGRRLDEDMRALALRALARLRLPNVLEVLLHHVEARRSVFGFGSVKLPAKSPIMLAALAGLAANWSSNPRARAILARAAAHADPDVRAAAAAPPTPTPTPTPSRLHQR
ncbi:MAG TPA: hypothetical protein VMM18_15780 [Gemmatimonadaceae bacterium]|nr:hypothetical protein [Gemmatimonadaceae bacterium]